MEFQNKNDQRKDLKLKSTIKDNLPAVGLFIFMMPTIALLLFIQFYPIVGTKDMVSWKVTSLNRKKRPKDESWEQQQGAAEQERGKQNVNTRSVYRSIDVLLLELYTLIDTGIIFC